MGSMELDTPLLTVLVVTVVVVQIVAGACHPPKIVQSEAKLWYFIEGEKITIPCLASGDGPLNYAWRRSGQRLPISNSTSPRYFMQPGVGSLVIDDTNTQDWGLYQCEASNDCGTSISDITTLRKAMMEPFMRIQEPRHLRVVEHGYAVLRCIPPIGDPVATLDWVVIVDNEYMYMDPVVYDHRFILDQWGSLHITDVRQEDERNRARYVCVASNPVLRRLVYGEDTIIHFSESPDHEHPAYLRWRTPRDIRVQKGSSATLQCIFSGNPTPSITWRKVNGQINDTRVTIDHDKLIFDNFQPSDVGSYECSGQNTHTRFPDVGAFDVDLFAKPEWVTQPSDVTARVGESASFECNAHADPTPNVQWFINGVPLNDAPVEPTHHLENNILSFTQLSINDSMVIQCNASNVHGYAWADNFLYVHD